VIRRVIALTDAEPEARQVKDLEMPIHRFLQLNPLALVLRLRFAAAGEETSMTVPTLIRQRYREEFEQLGTIDLAKRLNAGLYDEISERRRAFG
jgi:hypothetical protein